MNDLHRINQSLPLRFLSAVSFAIVFVSKGCVVLAGAKVVAKHEQKTFCFCPGAVA
jgi:hypothetical protein